MSEPKPARKAASTGSTSAKAAQRVDRPLREMFAAVEAQPIPEALLQLVEALDATAPGGRKRA